MPPKGQEARSSNWKQRPRELRCPESCSWEIAEVGFELRATESERAGRTIGLRRGRCCPELPVTPDPTSPFCPVTLYTGSLAGASLAHSVCSRVDTGSWRHPPPPRASPFLSCARRSIPCWDGQGAPADVCMGARVHGGLSGGVTARSYRHRPGLGPHPFLLLLCFPKVHATLSKKMGDPGWGGTSPTSCPKRAGLGSGHYGEVPKQPGQL